MNKQQLASKIWESANKMRSKIEANEYKDYILGFIFYKFLSDQEVKYLKGLGYTDGDIDTVTEDAAEIVEDVQRNMGYFIAYRDLFSTWLARGSDFNVSDVRGALSAFSRLIGATHKKVFRGVFDTLQTGLSKLGDTAGSQTKAISDLLHLIRDIPMDGKQDYDVLGFIYEYLISNFAANAGKKAGEFYTPHEVSLLMSEIVADHLKDRGQIEIYDPTSGSGSLLINIGKSAARYLDGENKIKYYAQEWKENTYNLTRMNLIMRGIIPSNIEARNGDTLEEDWPWFEDDDPIGTYKPLYVDAVVSNPPYSQHWNPADKASDPRYSPFGLAPRGKADYAFLLHDLYHLKPDGVMAIVLPHGVLFRGGEEGTIRKNLVEKNHIDAVIGLPPNIFFGTGIPTIIMVLRQKRERTDILIVDASKGFEKVGKNNRLRARDIKKITDAVTKRLDIEKFSRSVTREEVRANEYNLNIPRYVDSSDRPESWDIYASMFGGVPSAELDALRDYWAAFPGLREALFSSGEYSQLQVEDVRRAVREHPSVGAFAECYRAAFDGFAPWLDRELIQGMEGLNVSKEEAVLSGAVFDRLSGVPLVDPYEAYQILDDAWARISVDLEIIQTEGFMAVKQVDPNMTVKKKDGREQEVQDGWAGHVLPFGLVQARLLSGDLARLRAAEARLSEIAAGYEEALDALSEEDKDKDFINDDKTAFVWPEVKKALKAKEEEPYLLDALKGASKLNDEERALKKQIKDRAEALHLKTKAAIEGLTDAQALDLLREKWIEPLMDELLKLPENVVGELAARLEGLVAKYRTTFSEVEGQIAEAEKGLAGMLDQLTGSEFDMMGLAELSRILRHDGVNAGDKLADMKKAMLEKMFPREGRDVPEIRFAGFSGPWERRRLGDIGKARSGVGFPDAEQGGSVGIPFFKVSDMNLEGNENEMITANNYVTETQINNYMWNPVNDVPAIFFAKVGAAVMLNRKRLCRFPFMLDNNTMAYSLNYGLWDADFAKSLFETIDLTALVQIGALPSYNAGDVEAIEVYLPTLAEQSSMGQFFLNIDTLLTLTRRKLDKLCDLKKAMLEKMFV